MRILVIAATIIYLIVLFIGVGFWTLAKSLLGKGLPFWYPDGIGNLIVGFCLLAPALACLVFPRFSIAWLRWMASAQKRSSLLEWKDLPAGPRLRFYLVTLVTALLGLFLIFVGYLRLSGRQ